MANEFYCQLLFVRYRVLDTATDGTWVWDDGTVWDYQNWWDDADGGTAGGAVQNCLQVRRSDTTRDDANCSSEKWYVCKK